MTAFLQVVGGGLVAVVLGLALRQQGKDIALLLSVAMCCMVLVAAISYLKPVIEFVQQLQDFGNLDSDLMRILLKAVGIGLIAEIASLICSDAGNSALGKAIQMMASAVIIWLAIPLMKTLLDLVQQIMGEV